MPGGRWPFKELCVEECVSVFERMPEHFSLSIAVSSICYSTLCFTEDVACNLTTTQWKPLSEGELMDVSVLPWHSTCQAPHC